MGSSSTWTEDETLAEYFDELHRSAMAAYRENPNLIEEHANQEDQLRVGGYGDRIVRELVQNGADAMVGTSEGQEGSGRIEVVLDEDPGVLYVANAGRPFSRDGLRSITHAHLSGKRGDEIGRFGLGFKSVLAVTDRPQVFSESVAFEFGASSAVDELSSIQPQAKRFPVFRAASRLDYAEAAANDPVLEELGEWATTVIRLPGITDTDRLQRELSDFPTQFLLFVDSVRSIRLRIIGSAPLDQIHESRYLGGNRYAVESPLGDPEEWVVENRMHTPSREARDVVGDAVVRDRVKISVAVPVKRQQAFLGRFWSYFPLNDKTSASGLFNAPWSLNDDRTTLLNNRYNREIQESLLDMFISVLPEVSTEPDPARHLDYLPSRAGREYHSESDRYFRSQAPWVAAQARILPDANGQFQLPSDLRPFDLEHKDWVNREVHRYWQRAANTGDDVPHWTCYSNPTRTSRLEELLTAELRDPAAESMDKEFERARRDVPQRGLLAWVREWARGASLEDGVAAFTFVIQNVSKVQRLAKARVIPTNRGMVGLESWATTFIDSDGEVMEDGRSFVAPEFLNMPGVRERLENAGFRKLDAQTKFEALLSELTASSDDEQHQRIWDSLGDDLTLRQAEQSLADHGQYLKVPTLDGGWSWPHGVIALDGIDPSEGASALLDTSRAPLYLAKVMGVVDAPTAHFPLSSEICRAEYERSVQSDLNGQRGPGERPIERLAFLREEGPGPVSALMLLQRADAPITEIARWTTELLKVDREDIWSAEDPDSSISYDVVSPRTWAIRRAGLIGTAWGLRRPHDAVHQSLLRFEGFLPLCQESSALVEVLDLPRDLSEVPDHLIIEGLNRDNYSQVRGQRADAVLREFIEHAADRLGAEDLTRVPACAGDRIESTPVSEVYAVTDEEQVEYLQKRRKSYLRVPEGDVELFTMKVGVQAFEEVFAMGTEVSGDQEPEEITDVFTGFRGSLYEHRVRRVQFAKAEDIDQVVRTAEGGVERKALSWHFDNKTLYVPTRLAEEDVLHVINEAFELGMSIKDVEDILDKGQIARLEELKREAQGQPDDARRLEVYFTDEELRSVLPGGLWQTLEAQQLVDDSTSLGELFLRLEGDAAIEKLRGLFKEKGFNDVPEQWRRNSATQRWLKGMGFGPEYAKPRGAKLPQTEVVPGAVDLPPMHDYQERVSADLRNVLTGQDEQGRRLKAMVEMPTGAGKTRVASESILRLFSDEKLVGPVLWIAESKELCEQAVQTWDYVWRGLLDERSLTIGRLWETHELDEPEAKFSVIMATDAKIHSIVKSEAKKNSYSWLLNPSAVVVDEAHRTGDSEMYTQIFRELGVDGRSFERPLIGLSATPFKGGSDGTRSLARRFGENLIRAFKSENPYREAVDRGVLAEFEHDWIVGTDVRLSRKEREEAETFKRVNSDVLKRIGGDQERLNRVIEHILTLDADWPVLVFTPSVVSAQILAAVLRFRGVSAESVSGETDRDERRRVIDRFKKGRTRVLANCDLLTQGFDAPGVRALYVARPTFSSGAYIQMVGRGLRGPENGGKEKCLIVDVEDNFGPEDHLLGHRAYTDLWGENVS